MTDVGGKLKFNPDNNVPNLELIGASGSEITTVFGTLNVTDALNVTAGDSTFDGLVIFGAGASLTLSTNTITVTHSWHSVTSAGTINTINGGVTSGQVLYLEAGNVSGFTIADAAGNITTNTGANVTFAINQIAHLIYDGSQWHLMNAVT